MIKQTNLIILAIIIIGAAALGYNAWYKHQLRQDTATEPDPAAEQTMLSAPLIGRQRPDFTLKDMIGVPRHLHEWDGHIIVLNFWATWCRPCLQEIPMFTDIQRQIGEDAVRFIGIAVDDRATVEAFIARTGIDFNYPVLIGDDEAIPVAVDYGNETGILPYTVIIDAKGRISYFHFGAVDRERLETELNRLRTG